MSATCATHQPPPIIHPTQHSLLTTHYSPIPPIQRGTNPYTKVREVISGNEPSGTFKLEFAHRPQSSWKWTSEAEGGQFVHTGQGTQTTLHISASATEGQMEAALESLAFIDDVSVTRTLAAPGTGAGFAWTVTFEPFSNGRMTANAGNVHELQVVGVGEGMGGLGANVTVETLQEGTEPITGDFRIFFRGYKYTFANLKHDSTAAEVHAHFMRWFPSLPRPFAVAREGPRLNGGFTWLVTLPLGESTFGDKFSVDLPHLLPVAIPNVSVSAAVTTSISTPGTFHLKGTFQLKVLKDLPTMPASTMAAKVEAAAEAAYLNGSSFKKSNVFNATEVGADPWNSTTKNYPRGSGLNGKDDVLGQLLWETTDRIPYDASANDIRDALLALDTVQNVTTSLRSEEAFNGAKSWDVTFTGLRNAGDVPLMRTVSHLIGGVMPWRRDEPCTLVLGVPSPQPFEARRLPHLRIAAPPHHLAITSCHHPDAFHRYGAQQRASTCSSQETGRDLHDATRAGPALAEPSF